MGGNLEKVIEIFYPQTKERRVTTIKQNRDPNRWAISQTERDSWVEQAKHGERAHQVRLAAKLIDETLKDLRRV